MRFVVVLSLAALAALVACGGGTATRRDVVDGYRRELVRTGVHEAQARCLTERFFGALTDAELRAFQVRDALTDAERARFTQLGDECAGAT
jgi:hypothetical protein